jgi:serine/threonine-protein kinase
VFDAGVSDNKAYIAMELLKGKDLRQLLKEGWRASSVQAAQIVRRVADALSYAHSKGVIHRDIKPANIFMVGRTQPRVLDFGIARVTHTHDTHVSDEITGGSPYYMAPEQIRQQPSDQRADVFSLVVVLYELLTNVKPFAGQSLEEISKAVLTHEPLAPHVVKPGLAPGLSEVVMRAIEKDPEKRFGSARSLSRHLREWTDESGQQLGDAGPFGRSSAWARSTSLRWAGGSALGLISLGAAWWIWSQSAVGARAPLPAAVTSAATPANTAPPSVEQPPALTAMPAAGTSAEAATATTGVGQGGPGEPPAPVTAAAPTPMTAPVLAVDAAPASPAVPAAKSPVADMTSTSAPTVTIKPNSPKAANSKDLPKQAAKETPKDRRARETREREQATAAAVPLAKGMVRIAVSPWGTVEVNGVVVGTTPPLTEITLTEGRHQIVIRNGDFPPYSATVNVTPGQPVTVKTKFGS